MLSDTVTAKMHSIWLKDMSDADLKDIIDSLELILFDVDGVLALSSVPIPGSGECVLKLRELNKKIGIVTNNTFSNVKDLSVRLVHCGAKEEEISTPNNALLMYLDSIKFSKDIYFIGCSLSRNMLTGAGYNVIQYKDIQNEPVQETFHGLNQVLNHGISYCMNVGAVVLCYDFNYHTQAALVATSILRHFPNTLLISGATDDTGPISEKDIVIFARYYIEAIERWTNRKCIPMAKPSDALKNLLYSKYKITDPSKVLFVGDSLSTDIAFGNKCQFKTMLVLSGITKENQLLDGSFPKDQKPDYIASNLDELLQRIKNY